MKKIKLKLLATSGLGLIMWSATPTFSADDTAQGITKAGNAVINAMGNSGIVDWLSGTVGYENDRLSYDIMGFKGLSETKDSLNYLQLSLKRSGASNTLNAGFGVRRLTAMGGQSAIIGANVFFDSEDGTKKFFTLNSKNAYQQVSVGLELKTATFDVSANYYNPLSKDIILGKKVMKGYDVTAQGAIPNNEQITVGLNHYKFSTSVSGNSNVTGNKLLLGFRPNSVFSIRAEYDKPSGEKAKTNIFTEFKVAFGVPLSEQMKASSISTGGDAWAKRFDKVTRQYSIKKETGIVKKYTSSKIVKKAGANNDKLNVILSSGSAEVTKEKLFDAITITKAGGGDDKDKWEISKIVNTDKASEITVADDFSKFTVTGAITTAKTVTATLSHKTDSLINDVEVPFEVKSMNALVIGEVSVPYTTGNKDVSAETILNNMTTGDKEDWEVVSISAGAGALTKKGSNGKDGLTIGSAISSAVTETIVLKDKTGVNNNQSVTFRLKTISAGAVSSGSAKSGLSGKWGKHHMVNGYRRRFCV